MARVAEPKVKVTAIARGTINDPRGGIHHFNPDAKDTRAHGGMVSMSVAIAARDKGLVEIVGKTDRARRARPVGPSVAEVAAERDEKLHDGLSYRASDLGQVFGTGGLSTIATTAFPDNPLVTTRVIGDDIEDLDEDDDDVEQDLDDEDDDEVDERTFDELSFEEQQTALAGIGGGAIQERGNAGGADAPPIERVDAQDGEHREGREGEAPPPPPPPVVEPPAVIKNKGGRPAKATTSKPAG